MGSCRLCLCSGKKVLSIFDTEMGNLSDKIEACVSIKVCRNDYLTTSICISCVNQVTQWEVFKNCCHKTKDILLTQYNNAKDHTIHTNFDNTSKSTIHRKQPTYEHNSEEEEVILNDKDSNDLEKLLDNNDCKLDTNNVYICEICSVELNDCLEYLDHQETHDGKPVFSCSKCTEVFTSRKDLLQHDSNHRNPCKHCGKMIAKSSMKLHLNRHTDKFKCSKCSGRFNSRAELGQHIITVHTDIRDHICETCGKRFASPTAMRVHMKSHSDDRMYPCKQCSYAGRTASALYIHMSTHANDLCVCEFCSKTFKSTRNLNDHLRRVHCKNKKHECTYCMKRFVDGYILRVHMRCHTGVRPYKCTKCDKSFIRSDGLKEHMLTHGQRAFFDCKECRKRFTSKRGVTRHTCTGLS